MFRILFNLIIYSIFLGLFSNIQAQEVSSESEEEFSLSEDVEWEDDEEIYELEVESVENQNMVDEVFNEIDIITDLLSEDTSLASWAVYSGSEGFLPYTSNKDLDAQLLKRYDVIMQTENEEQKFTYIKEYIFNENQAWDFIYERIYSQDGNLRYFSRHYNTYNSGCAQVALEESDYFFNSAGELIKKTYSIYDSQNNPLDINDCFMERESYEKYMTLRDFLDANPLPLWEE